jgi:hypothetical protein
MHFSSRWGQTHRRFLGALAALFTGLLAPEAAADLAGQEAYYQVTSAGQQSYATVAYASDSLMVSATDPRTGKPVNIAMPPFEELLIDGKSYTFTFSPVPGQKRAHTLTLQNVTLHLVLMNKSTVCQGSEPLKFVRLRSRPKFTCPPFPKDFEGGGDEDPCSLAWGQPTERRCGKRLGLHLERVPENSGPPVHWMELAGISFDWKDLPTVAVYCHLRDDPLCPGRFDYGNWNDQPTLLWAVKNKAPAVISALAKTGADFNSPFLFGREALVLSIQEQQLDLVRALLEGGVKVKARPDQEADSPLVLAASLGNAELVELLLAAGADVAAKDADGTTARDAAVAGGHTRIVELLDAWSAKSKARAKGQRTR